MASWTHRTALGLALLAAALAVAAAGMSRTLEGPWQRGWLGHNGARYAHIARNYARHGLLHLRGAPLVDAGVHDPAQPDVYGHHPPGLPWALALLARGADGPTERAARLFALGCTLLALLLLAALVAPLGGIVGGGVAALAAAAMPMVSVYGAHVDVQGPPVAAASLAVVWAYRRMLAGRSALPLVGATVLASAFDWYGLYAPVGCALHLAWTRPDRRRAAAALLGGALLLFAGWAVWLVTLPTMSASRLGGAAAVRGLGALLAAPGGGARVAGWLAETGALMPGWPALLLLALGVVAGLVPVRARSGGPGREAGATGGPTLGERGLVALLVVPPLVHGGLFPAGMLVHDYWLFALPYGLAAALAFALRPVAGWVTAAALAVLLLAGHGGADRVLDPVRQDAIPALVGRSLAEQTAPPDVVLTNYHANPLSREAPAGYVLAYPEVTYYADRVVRGGIDTAERLGAALELYPGAAWFLLTPPPAAFREKPPPAALAAVLERRAVGPPRQLSDDPPVWLFRLAP